MAGVETMDLLRSIGFVGSRSLAALLIGMFVSNYGNLAVRTIRRGA